MTAEDLRAAGWTERDERWFPPKDANAIVCSRKSGPAGLTLRDALVIEEMRARLAAAQRTGA